MNNCVNFRVKCWSWLYDLKGIVDDKMFVVDGVAVYYAYKRFYNVNLLVRECFGCYCDVFVFR